jgi:hypothetical protein
VLCLLHGKFGSDENIAPVKNVHTIGAKGQLGGANCEGKMCPARAGGTRVLERSIQTGPRIL